MAMGPAIITDITSPQHRGKSLGVVAVSVSVALTAGPVLGGFLTAAFGWSSIFFVNIPIGIIASIWSWKVIPGIKGHLVEPFDIKGAVLIFLALLAMLIPLSYTEQFGWRNPYILSTLAVGVIILFVFIFIEKTVEYPMVDLTMFQNRLFAMGNLSALLNYVAAFAVMLIMPFYLQQLRQMSAEQAGFLLIPTPLTMMVIAPIAGAISDKVDSRYISSLGMAINAIGLWMLSRLQVNSSTLTIVSILVVIGLGSGLFQTPNNSAVMGAVQPNRRGIASSLLANMRNIGMVLGVAISGALFSSRQAYLSKVLAAQGLTAAEIKTQAFIGAMQFTFLFAAALALVAVFTSLVRGPLNTNKQ
jgi:EmrB/QacA subfamily drug resistance transporter